MDFILRDSLHDEHDEDWILHSRLYEGLVCLGCIVETIENKVLLPLQKKAALAELHRLLSQQTDEILPLFMQEERIVWHIVVLLFENLEVEESYAALSIDTLLKIVHHVGSEDLVNLLLDNLTIKIENHVGDDGQLLPYYTFLGKMLYQLPGIRQTLPLHYSGLLHELSLALCNAGETTQTAISYIFIFLLDIDACANLPAQVAHQVNYGIVRLLSTAENMSIQINALGLLKKLIRDPVSCADLMSVCVDGCSLLTCVKKVLLSKNEVLQTGICQILLQMMEHHNNQDYTAAILESDLLEFLFEVLHTDKTVQIECILKLLQKFSRREQFYKRCHAVYGVESILRALCLADEMKNALLVTQGLLLITDILTRHPEEIPLFLSSSVVNKCIQVIGSGLEHQDKVVFHQAMQAFSALLRKKYLLSPVPFSELTRLVTVVTQRVWDDRSQRSRTITRRSDRREGHNDTGPVEVTGCYVDILNKSVTLIIQCQTDAAACESSFTAPCSQPAVPSMTVFSQTILQVSQDTGVPLIMLGWDVTADRLWCVKCLQYMCVLHQLENARTCDILHKLVISGFLITVLELKVKYNMEAAVSEVAGRFMELCIQCCQTTGLLPDNVDHCQLIYPTQLTCSMCKLAALLDGQSVCPEMVQSYLLLLYLAFKHENRIISMLQLCDVLVMIKKQHGSLQWLPSLARRHFIYLLAWVTVIGEQNMQLAFSHDDASTMVEGRMEDWYSHDILLLQWCFTHPVMAALAGHAMVCVYVGQCSMEEIAESIETYVDNTNHPSPLLQLCEQKHFIKCLVSSITTLRSEDNDKVMRLLQAFIHNQHIATTADVQENDSEVSSLHDDCSSKMGILEYALESVNETLHKTFLHSPGQPIDQGRCQQSGQGTRWPIESGPGQHLGHSIASLLELLLLLVKCLPDQHIHPKTLHHVLNAVSKYSMTSEHLLKTQLLTVLAAISTTESSAMCTIAGQHDGLIACVESCMAERAGEILYCISCDILTVFLQYNGLKLCRPVSLDMYGLFESVCRSGSWNTVVSGLRLMSAVYRSRLTHASFPVQTPLTKSQYTTLYIQLQQYCLQELCSVSESAVDCLVNMINYLCDVKPSIGEVLLCQPWNILLMDVLTELLMVNVPGLPASPHYLNLLSMFIDHKTSAVLMRSSPALIEKLVCCLKAVDGEYSLNQAHMSKAVRHLAKQLMNAFEDVLSTEHLTTLKVVS